MSAKKVKAPQLLLVVSLIGVLLVGIGTPAVASSGPKARDGLHLRFVDIPNFHNGYYYVSGTVPQIDEGYLYGFKGSPNWRHVLHVNADVGKLATSLEGKYWKNLTRYCKLPPLLRQPGYFVTLLNPSLILANNATLSFVVPEYTVSCGVTDDDNAISATYSLETGKEINLLSLLFRSRLAGVSLLAQQARHQFYDGSSRSDRCIQQQDGGTYSLNMMRGLISHADDFGTTHVALVKKGVSVLIAQCYLAACACGDSEVTIPYSKIWRALSANGRQLISGVR
jgi:hypothetical protein